MARMNPQWSVIVGGADKPDNIAKSQALVHERKRKFPRTAFGVRWWHARDDKMAANFVRDYGSVKNAADMYASIFFPLAIAGTWLMAGNEEAASESDPSVFKQTVDVHTAILRRANDAGIAIGTCCTAMGEPQYGQYELLAPLFRAMQDGRAKGIYHIWRPNTYFPHSIGKTEAEMASLRYHLTQRHQREGRRVAAANGLQFPPTAFGEFNTVVSLEKNLDGPNSIPSYSAQQWGDDLLKSDVDLPYAVYCEGDGLYDDKWKSFKLTREFIEVMITRLPRRKLTLIHEWKEKNPMPTNSLHRLKITGFPPTVPFRNIRTVAGATDANSDIGDLRVEDVVDVILPPDAAGWINLTRLSDGIRGYVLWTGVLTEAVPVPPQPTVKGRYLSSDVQARIRTHSKAIDDHNAAIMAELDAAPEVAVPEAPF